MDDVTMIALRREPGHFVRSLTALVLRVGLGMSLLMYGLHKFEAKQAGKYPGMITAQFKDTPLGKQMPQAVKLFADVLPYAEVGLGALLIAGLLTTLTAALSGFLLLNLTFGLLVQGDPSKIPPMMTYLLVNAGILWLSPVTSNYISLDGLFAGWFWRPRPEAEFRTEKI